MAVHDNISGHFIADYTSSRRVDTPPPYVGNDYFCDARGGGNLWDGIDCPGTDCCALIHHHGFIRIYLGHLWTISKFVYVLMRAIAMKMLA